MKRACRERRTRKRRLDLASSTAEVGALIVGRDGNGYSITNSGVLLEVTHHYDNADKGVRGGDIDVHVLYYQARPGQGGHFNVSSHRFEVASREQVQYAIEHWRRRMPPSIVTERARSVLLRCGAARSELILTSIDELARPI